HYKSWSELFASIRRLTGRRLPALPTPGFLGRASGRAMDGLQRLTRARLPFGYQGAWIITSCAGMDDTATRAELGIEPLSLEQTLADTIRRMVQAGRLPPKLAGELVAADSTVGGTHAGATD